MSAVMESSTLPVQREAKPARVSERQQRVLDVLIANHRQGGDPLTAGEIQERLERRYAPMRFDYGRVTDLLDQLRQKGMVAETGELKFNLQTQRNRSTWVIPLSQARLFA